MKKTFVFLLILFNANFAFGYVTENVSGGCVTGVSEPRKIYAVLQPHRHTCATGYYLPANYDEGCVPCPSNAECPGGTYDFNKIYALGITYDRSILNNVSRGCNRTIVPTTGLKALFTVNAYTCTPGYYVPANHDGCVICPSDSYCPGGTYTFNQTVTQGITACPTGYDYNTTPGKTDITQCQIHCDGGTWNGEYTQLEYIESTGTQYIDTGVVPTFNSGVYMKVALTTKKSGDNIVFGATSSTAFADGNPFSIDIYSTTVALPFGGNGGSYSYNSISLVVNTNQIHDYKINYLNNGKAAIDDLEVGLGSSASMTTNSLYLFNLHSSSGGISQYATSGARIYEVLLTESNNISHHYIPVRRNSDGAIGMYDMVSDQFFANAGTGAFIAGGDVGLISGQCVDVGAGYYAPASTVNFGSVGTRNACVAPTTTVGYGRGADEAADCGRILHIGDEVVYLRASKKTSPALHVDVDNDGIADFFGNATTADVVMHAGNIHKLKLQVGDTVYSIYDDTVNVGE